MVTGLEGGVSALCLEVASQNVGRIMQSVSLTPTPPLPLALLVPVPIPVPVPISLHLPLPLPLPVPLRYLDTRLYQFKPICTPLHPPTPLSIARPSSDAGWDPNQALPLTLPLTPALTLRLTLTLFLTGSSPRAHTSQEIVI